jgi:hypothetical protein
VAGGQRRDQGHSLDLLYGFGELLDK